MTRKIAAFCALFACLGLHASLQAFERDGTLGPAPVTTIAAEDLKLSSTTNISDLLRNSPANPGATTGAADVTIRGTGFSVGSPLVLVNGVRTSGDISDLDPDLIEEINIVKGASASALYGADASNGLVLITTRPGAAVADASGSAALPATASILNDYSLAIQSNEYCDATNGALLPVHLWFPDHNYGIGNFSDSRKQQYWGSVDEGFKRALPPPVTPPRQPDSPARSGTQAGADIAAESWRDLQKVTANPNIARNDKLMAALVVMQNYATLQSAGATALRELELFNPALALSAVRTAFDASGIAQADGALSPDEPLPMQYQYTQLYMLFMKILAHPSASPESKSHAFFSLIQNPRLYHPMLSDAGFVLGLFDPDAVLAELVERDAYEASFISYTQFQNLFTQALQNPDYAAADRQLLFAALMLNAQLFGVNFSDAAFTMGHMNPDTVLEIFEQIMRSNDYLAIQPTTTVTLIDKGQELLEQWVDMLQSVSTDANLSEASRLQITRGLLYYALYLGRFANTPAVSEIQFDSAAILQGFYSTYGQLSPSGYADTDPFSTHDLPPASAFDFRYCSEDQRLAMLEMIRKRDAFNDTAMQMWDYIRHPDTTHADQVEATSIALDAEAEREELNLALQDMWKGCTRTNVEAISEPTFSRSTGPSINVEIFESGENGIAKPVSGLAVLLKKSNDIDKQDLPFSLGAVRNTSLGADLPGDRLFTGIDGIARQNEQLPNSELPGSSGSAGLERSPWQIKADYDTHSISVKLEYDRVDSIIQTFPGYGAPGMNFDQLPAEIQAQIPAGFTRPNRGFSIGDNFNVSHAYKESTGIDLSVLDSIPNSSWSNNDCGDSALPQEGSGYLTSAETPIKSVDDRWDFGHVGLTADKTPVGSPVVVAVIDTGLDWNHLDFAWDNLWRNAGEIPDNGVDDDNNGYVDDLIGWDFTADNNRPWDYDGHGTFVAGLIGATGGNDVGIDGINPNVRIMVLKALNNFGRTRASYVARAIVYAADNGAQIINLSVSGPGFPPAVHDAVDYAHAKGLLIVASAGNGAEDIDAIEPTAPKNIMLVSATDATDRRAVFSNVGSAISVAAPGVDIVSLRARATDFMYNKAETSYVRGDAFLGDDYRYYRSSGTSFAAPIVSGIASLVWSERRQLTAQQVRRIVEQSARDVEAAGRDRLTGFGVVDAGAALAADPDFFIDAEISAVTRADKDGEVLISVRGLADANLFGYGTLEIGLGHEPASWQKVGENILVRVHDAVLAQFPAGLLEGSEVWTLRLSVEHATGKRREARYTLNLEQR